MSVEGSNKVCHQSEITRATFDLYFDGLSAVVDELLEEVLNTAQRIGRPPEGDLIEFMAQLGERDDPALLMKYYDQLPACLRAATGPRGRGRLVRACPVRSLRHLRGGALLIQKVEYDAHDHDNEFNYRLRCNHARQIPQGIHQNNARNEQNHISEQGDGYGVDCLAQGLKIGSNDVDYTDQRSGQTDHPKEGRRLRDQFSVI